MHFEFSENCLIPSDDPLPYLLSLNDGTSPKWFVSSLKQQSGIHKDKAYFLSIGVCVCVCFSAAVLSHSDAGAVALW